MQGTTALRLKGALPEYEGTLRLVRRSAAVPSDHCVSDAQSTTREGFSRIQKVAFWSRDPGNYVSVQDVTI